MKTAPPMRSGCSAARSSARCAPSDRETSTARSVSVASITASASAANSRSSYPLGRAVRAAVAAPVEGDDAAVPCEVRDLHLPVPRVDDRPRRQEEHRGLARAVDLVVEVHAVAFDVARRCRDSAHASARMPAPAARRSLSAPPGTRRSTSSSSLVPGLDAAEPLDDDPQVERHHERDERLERHLDAELAMRLLECLGEHRAPLGVHAREALAQVGLVPRERLQLEPDLLVGDSPRS